MGTAKLDGLQLDEGIIRAITRMEFEEASPIQAQAIPIVMKSRDMIGQIQTGTDKTAAFGIPLLRKVDPKVKKLQTVILLPTRELAIQVAEEMRRPTKFMHGTKVLPIYGGRDIVKQICSLEDGTQVVVGIPGRVIDHMRRKTTKMDHVHAVVLDEADEMLNMGFLGDIKTILSQLPGERQTLTFSTTMPQAITDIVKKLQDSPMTVRVTKKELTIPKVTQYYYEVKPKNKAEVICRLLDMYTPKPSIVFCNTKRQVNDLVQALQGRGCFAEGLHEDLKQIQHDRVMDSFRNGRAEVLMATDVAARGVDVGDVEVVSNYDVPQDDECYVHRIGRTGRTGHEGKAFSLVMGKEVYKPHDIQHCCKTKIIPQAIPSLNDVTEIKVEKVPDQVMDILSDSGLTKMVSIIEKKLMEEGYVSLDLVVALLKINMGNDNEDVIDCTIPARSLDELDNSERNTGQGHGRERGASFRKGRRGAMDRAAVDYVLNSGGEKVARFFVSIGKAQKVAPGDILGAVAGESGIPDRVVRSIDMCDGYMFVNVPGQYTDKVLRAMSHTKVKRKNVHAEKANNRR